MTYAQKPQLTTPAGSALYPSLTSPDMGPNDAWAGTGGKYNVKLLMDPEDCKEFVSEIDRLYEENYVAQCKKTGKKDLKKANKPYSPHVDKDGNPSGMLQFNFAMKAKGTTKTGEQFERKPKFFGPDGGTIPFDQVPVLGNGSTLKISHFVDGWHTSMAGAGVSLRIRGVQILNVIERDSGGNAEDHGFSCEGEALATAPAPTVEAIDAAIEESDHEF